MKLAEALLLRGDLQRVLASLRERIGKNTLVQEDERPSEDPAALLASAEAVIRRLQKVTFAINEANLAARTAKGRPLTLVLAERDAILQRHGLLKTAASSATQQPERYGTKEIRWVRTIDVEAIQQSADEAAIAYREVNAEIQAANWTVELTAAL